MASLIDDAGVTRFDGTITGAGIETVTCMAQAPVTDIHTAASHPLKWSDLVDNPWDFNVLTAIPAGLGLAFLFNGTAATITTTAAGTWAFTLSLSFVQDATWTGVLVLDANNLAQQSGVGNVPNPQLAVSEVVTYPVGASIAPEVVTDGASIANPLNASANLTIVRLG